RAVATDPGRPWWSAAGMVAAAILAVALARWTLGRGYVYAAAFLLNLATTVCWLEERPWSWQRPDESLTELFQVNVIALALPAVAWMFLELQVLRHRRAELSVSPTF